MNPRAYLPHEKWEILLEALGSARGPDEVCLRRGISLVELRRWLNQAREGALLRLSESASVPVSSPARPPPGTAAPGACSDAPHSPPAAGPPREPDRPEVQRPPLTSSAATQVRAPTQESPASAAAALRLEPSSPSDRGPGNPIADVPAGHQPEGLNVAFQTLTALSGEEIDTMFSMVSHELKEPLRGIKAISQFMREDFDALLPERGVSYLEMLSNTAERMQRLVEGLSEFARSGQIRDSLQPVPLGQLLEHVRAQLQPFLAERLGVVLVDSRLPTVMGHAESLALAFRQLIHNGIKFNPSQPPRVEVVASPEEPDSGFRCIVVRDNGIGIDARHQDRIFDLFQRLHRYDEYPGAGVGLSITRRIITAHGGTIELELTPAPGSAFKVRLPGVG